MPNVLAVRLVVVSLSTARLAVVYVLWALLTPAVGFASGEVQAPPEATLPPVLPSELTTTLLRVKPAHSAVPSPEVPSPAVPSPAVPSPAVPSPAVPSPDVSSPDLQTLAQWLGNATLVGLGESSHGTDDYHRVLHRVFAHLVREEGFDVLALEISQAHATRLDDFVHGRRDDLDALLAERWWVAKVFYDEALRDLLLWMRSFVEAGGRPIHIAGFDFKQPSFAIAELAELLQALDAEAAAKVAALYATVDSLGGLGVFPNVSGFTAEATLDLSASETPRPVRFSVWVRGVGVEHGSVGLLVRGRGRQSGALNESHSLTPVDLTAEWTRLEVDIEVPADMTRMLVGFYHRANGSVWLDDLVVEVEGERVATEGKLQEVVPWPLMIPAAQRMDYELVTDRDVFRSSPSSVRVDCSAVVDKALAAVRAASTLLDDVLAASQLSSIEIAWAHQMARLVEQSVEWRTLVDNNRDVSLTANVTWLQREGYPGRRMLVFGHTSHIERIPGRMGGYLAAARGDDYVTISMLTLAGDYVYFGDPGTVAPNSALEAFVVDPEQHVGRLEHELAPLADGNPLLFHLAATADTVEGRQWLEFVRARSSGKPQRDTDVVVLLQRVNPLIPLASDR